MSITFDDQSPQVTTVRERRIQDKQVSIEKLLLKLGLAQNKQQASKLAVVVGIGIILVCSMITFLIIRPDPVDESRYYDPITGEPVFASER